VARWANGGEFLQRGEAAASMPTRFLPAEHHHAARIGRVTSVAVSTCTAQARIRPVSTASCCSTGPASSAGGTRPRRRREVRFGPADCRCRTVRRRVARGCSSGTGILRKAIRPPLPSTAVGTLLEPFRQTLPQRDFSPPLTCGFLVSRAGVHQALSGRRTMLMGQRQGGPATCR
jgi:hypothetical protein